MVRLNVQITEEELIGLLDQISAEETKKKETKIVVTFSSHGEY
jgi:DNA-binding TFAR19-related protein (PDSD5 family)